VGAEEKADNLTDDRYIMREVPQRGNTHKIIDVGLNVSPYRNVEKE
jgi:hypothetical protein